MADWIQIPFSMPIDTQIVWVRTDRWSGAPFLAKYSLAKKTFTDQISLLAYPFYTIVYWKPQ